MSLTTSAFALIRSARLAVVVSGLSGSGKTTIARSLAERLAIPLVERDRFAEIVFDALRTQVPDGRSLGPASWELLFAVAADFMSSRCSLVLESNFSRARHVARLQHLVSDSGYRLIEVHCQAPGDVLLDRFTARALAGQRHARHEDMDRIEEFRAIFGDPERHGDALLFPAHAIRVDTTTAVSIDGLIDDLLAATVEPPRAAGVPAAE